MPGKPEETVHQPDVFTDKTGLDRLIFFCDAVFAIAITLLSLDIRLPESDLGASNLELMQSLLAIWPKYMAYILSFLVIGSFWISHHRKFRSIQRYDSRFLWLNVLFMMMVAFTPFPTSLLSEYGNRTSTIFYALVIMLGGFIMLALWRHASHHDRLIDPNMSAHQRRREALIPILTIAIFAVSIGLAFVDVTFAKATWLAAISLPFILR